MSIPHEPEDPAALLRAQLEDLARFRHVVEAQRAVLRMEDARLLRPFAREASAIADTVLARDAVLLALRSAARQDPAIGRKWAPSLETEVQQARIRASAESLALAREMEQTAQDIARDLEGVGRRMDEVVGRHFGRDIPGQPVIVDRTA